MLPTIRAVAGSRADGSSACIWDDSGRPVEHAPNAMHQVEAEEAHGGMLRKQKATGWRKPSHVTVDVIGVRSGERCHVVKLRQVIDDEEQAGSVRCIVREANGELPRAGDGVGVGRATLSERPKLKAAVMWSTTQASSPRRTAIAARRRLLLQVGVGIQLLPVPMADLEITDHVAGTNRNSAQPVTAITYFFPIVACQNWVCDEARFALLRRTL